MELIAHRAGNEVHLVAPALVSSDAIELDLHMFRGRLEVRHAKVLWPLGLLWERWELLPGAPRPTLEEILEVVPPGTHLWFDLKGYSRRLPRRLLEIAGERRPMTTSCRSWWVLRTVRRVPGIRTFRSVAGRRQLWLVQRLRFPDEDDGIVMHERLATPETVARLRRLTPNVVTWAVDDLDRALELLDMGVTGVIADDVAMLAALRLVLIERGRRS